MTAANGTIHLSFPAMQAAESSLTHQLTVLRSRLEQLAGDLQPLVHSWSGEAQAAYLVQKQRWEAAAADLATMLGAITSALGSTTADYLATESRIAAAFG
jgi:early secretory antigenic target protein ESAT-6